MAEIRNVTVLPDGAALAAACADHLLRSCARRWRERDLAHLALAGGSTPRAVNALLTAAAAARRARLEPGRVLVRRRALRAARRPGIELPDEPRDAARPARDRPRARPPHARRGRTHRGRGGLRRGAGARARRAAAARPDPARHGPRRPHRLALPRHDRRDRQRQALHRALRAQARPLAHHADAAHDQRRAHTSPSPPAAPRRPTRCTACSTARTSPTSTPRSSSTPRTASCAGSSTRPPRRSCS